MKILFIAPLPPPIGGHSLVSKVLWEELNRYHQIKAINFNKETFIEGFTNLSRLIKIFGILFDIWRDKKKADIVYLTISESLAGNLKDLMIYLICYKKLNNMFIHLHGGTIKKELWDRHGFIFKLNKVFINRMGGVIISGRSHLNIFENIIPRNKIHIVPNFAQRELFLSEENIRNKFEHLEPIRFLYISNFIEKKGYNELVDAYLSLNSRQKEMIRIDFAGRFDNKEDEKKFLNKIKNHQELRYHGVVSDEKKRVLFSEAHVFSLPTSFLEGQPISILEAYASGCVVITTGPPGIRDIFVNGINGIEIGERSADSIRSAIGAIYENRDELLPVAISNRFLAGKNYQVSSYISAIKKLLESNSAKKAEVQ
jgi:glycosyltransferase involved in cell wall biosynthesis